MTPILSGVNPALGVPSVIRICRICGGDSFDPPSAFAIPWTTKAAPVMMGEAPYIPLNIVAYLLGTAGAPLSGVSICRLLSAWACIARVQV